MAELYDVIYLSGEKKHVAIDITSGVAFTVSNQTFSLKRCSDQSIILNAVAAVQEPIADGVKIKYNLDTAGLDPGSYLGIFEFSRDGIETRKKTVSINIKDFICS